MKSVLGKMVVVLGPNVIAPGRGVAVADREYRLLNVVVPDSRSESTRSPGVGRCEGNFQLAWFPKPEETQATMSSSRLVRLNQMIAPRAHVPTGFRADCEVS